SGEGFLGSPDPLFDPTNKTIFTISAIAFDFDFTTSDPSKSRADEIRILVPKNKKPPKKSKEGKPGGFGLPTGQLESNEAMLHAVERETEDETGCSVTKIIGKLFVVHKRVTKDGEIVPNEIHVFLVEASEPLRRVREIDEIDASVDPWITLRQVFEMPHAQDKNGGNRNPDGIYFQHLKRLYRAIEFIVYGPGPEDLIDDAEVVKQWAKPNRRALVAAMINLKEDGLLDRFLPPEEEVQEEEIPA
ncbi:MAG: NUDIX hydrolase, partial [bacterium]|nr:NUDIX hydrolase [bacterium]